MIDRLFAAAGRRRGDDRRFFLFALRAAYHARRGRRASLFRASNADDDDVESRWEAGLPFYDFYDVDVDGNWPSPSEYHSEIAEREHAAKAPQVEQAVQTAEIAIAATKGACDVLLTLARKTGRDTAGGFIEGWRLKDRLLAAAGIAESGHESSRLRYEVEVSIEAARENLDEPYDDAKTSAYVTSIVERFAPMEAAEPEKRDETVATSAEQAETATQLACNDGAFVQSTDEKDGTEQNSFGLTRAPRDADAGQDIEALAGRAPGLVGDLVQWINASAEEPCATLALAAALPFIGSLAGRLYASPSGIRTNLYTVGLAPSGIGKEHARRCIKNLAAAAGLDRWLGAGIASGTGLRRRVEAQGSVFYLIDEFHVTMSEMNNPHNVNMGIARKLLLEFFAAANSVFAGVDYAGEQGVVCHNPNVCLYGTSTPDRFWASLGSIAVAEGLLPRFLVCNATTVPEDVIPTASAERPPEALKAACRALTMPKVGDNLSVVNARDGAARVEALVVPYGPGADEAYWAFKKKYKELARNAGSQAEPFYRRVNEHATKLALIIAAGVDPDSPMLTVELLELGQKIAEASLRDSLKEASGRLADNDRQREHLDVRRWIEAAGPDGLSRTNICRLVNGRFDARRRDDILKTLVEDEGVISLVLMNNSRGPRGSRFIATRYLNRDCE